ncbi:MAG TPA: YraN family protein [Salinivirgaceae bacterium]|nr:YraN family protein [Salinivirgaceae bacterium]
MSEPFDLGKKGEELACQHLMSMGYTIHHRNWRFRKYEIDIVATQNNTLVFVEVKTRTPGFISKPEDSMNKGKQRQLIEGAHEYIKQNHWNADSRIDLVKVYIDKQKVNITHIENAVTPKW